MSSWDQKYEQPIKSSNIIVKSFQKQRVSKKSFFSFWEMLLLFFVQSFVMEIYVIKNITFQNTFVKFISKIIVIFFIDKKNVLKIICHIVILTDFIKILFKTPQYLSDHDSGCIIIVPRSNETFFFLFLNNIIDFSLDMI